MRGLDFLFTLWKTEKKKYNMAVTNKNFHRLPFEALSGRQNTKPQE